MVSIKPFVGRVPFKRALRFARKNTPDYFGAMHRRKNPLVSPKNFIALLEQKASLEGRGKRTLRSIKSKQNALEMAKKIFSEEGHIPSSAELAAAIALESGLDSEKTKKQSSIVNALLQRAGKSPLRVSVLQRQNPVLFQVMANGSLTKIMNALESKNSAVDVQRLCKETGLSFGKVSSVLQILESMKLVQRLPSNNLNEKVPRTKWIVQEKRLSVDTFPSGNAKYHVMELLSKGPKTISEISKNDIYSNQKKPERIVQDNKFSKLFKVNKNINLLTQMVVSGLVVKSIKKNNSGKFVEQYELSSKGKKIFAEQQGRRTITPEMRNALLQRNEMRGLISGDIKRISRIVDYITKRMEFEKVVQQKGNESVPEIMKRTGLSLTAARRIKYLHFIPWASVPKEKLIEKIIPEIEKISPEKAQWLRNYLANPIKRKGADFKKIVFFIKERIKLEEALENPNVSTQSILNNLQGVERERVKRIIELREPPWVSLSKQKLMQLAKKIKFREPKVSDWIIKNLVPFASDEKKENKTSEPPTAKVLELFNNNQGLAYDAANRVHKANMMRGRRIEFDDVAQTSLLALFRAAKNYKKNISKFSTYGTVSALRGPSKLKPDGVIAKNKVLSLDEPIGHEDGGDISLLDLVPRKDTSANINNATNLRRSLIEVISESSVLSIPQKNILLEYLNHKSGKKFNLSEIARREQITTQAMQYRFVSALKLLGKDKAVLNKLSEFVE